MDHNPHDMSQSSGTSAEQKLRAELADLARNGPKENQEPMRPVRDADSALIDLYPILALGFLGLLSVTLPYIGFGNGMGKYIGVVLFALAAIGGVTVMNRKHQNAYVAKKMASGMSRLEAERDYRNKYDG